MVAAIRDALATPALVPRWRVDPLGTLFYRQGRLAEALAEYAHALRLSPDDNAIRCERARVLVEANQPFRRFGLKTLKALDVDPSSVACLINATWLFAAHQDAEIGSPTEVVRL